MRRYAFEATVIHLLWAFGLFLWTDGLTLSFSDWLAGFNQWDVRWYSSMAMDGHGFLPQTYAFPPLNGWLLGKLTYAEFYLARTLGFDPIWMQFFSFNAFAVGLTAFAAANTVFVILSERRWKIARPRLWLIAISNPVGYFAFTAYSDVLFFCTVMFVLGLATWTSPRRSAWNLQELSPRQNTIARSSLIALLFLAPWLRLTGYAFSIWIFLKRKETIVIFLSLALYLGYIHHATDDFLFFLKAQDAFGMPTGNIINGFSMSFQILYAFFNGDAYRGGDFFIYAVNFGFLPMIALALSLVLVFWLYKRDEKLWALMILAMTFLSHNQAFWRSTIRYTLPIYPMMYWLVLADAKPIPVAKAQPTARRRCPRLRSFIFACAIGISFAIQLFYCRLFLQGLWAF